MSDLHAAIEHFENSPALRREFAYTLQAMKDARNALEQKDVQIEDLEETLFKIMDLADKALAPANAPSALEQCHRELARTANAIDDIYRASDEGRKLVCAHYGSWHPQFVAELPDYKGSQTAGNSTPDHCEWFEDDDGWHGSCGKAWEFTYDGPTENGLKFCMNCGKLVRLEPESVENTGS